MTSQFELTVDGAHALIRCSGDIDVSNADDLVALGFAAWTDEQVVDLTVDLASVTFMDSSGLGALIHLRRRADSSGKRVSLGSVPPLIVKIMTITGLHTVFGLPSSDGVRQG